MKCYQHADLDAAAFCRSCGRPLCSACQRSAQGTVYCEEHVPALPAALAAPARVASPPLGGSPGLAFVLGLIPGVGAIYNGQYVKGLVHVVVLGTLISIVESGAGGFEPLFGLLIALWFFYMAFEAYHTASKRLRGEPVDEFSSLIPMGSARANSTAAPLALSVLGVLCLIMTTRPDWTRWILKLWPVLLIAAGVYLLLGRLRNRAENRPETQEAPRELQ